MQTTHSDAFRLLFDQDNINIQFGNYKFDDERQDNKVINLLDDIVMKPAIARRLISSLNESIRSHEHQYGVMKLNSNSKQKTSHLNTGNKQFDLSSTNLIDMINRLGIPYYYEPSFRLCECELLTDRFLITINLHEIRFQPLQCVLDICTRLNFPMERLEMFTKEFTKAKSIHFGLEGKRDSVICKVYLEFNTSNKDIKVAVKPSVLLHLAFKWDVLNNQSNVITHYYWYPLTNTEELLKRTGNIYQSKTENSSFNITKSLIELIADKIPIKELQYLEVMEEGNERRSFDLNLYDARLQVREIYSVLKQMRDHFSLRPGEFQALYDHVKSMVIGHIAGGIHRNEKEFFNVYYGVENHHG